MAVRPAGNGDEESVRAPAYMTTEGEASSRGGVEEHVKVTVAAAKEDAELHAARE